MSEIEVKEPKLEETANQTVEISIAILIKQDRVWIQQRSGTDHLEGFWEFPGGKIEAGETPVEAMKREVWEETGYQIDTNSIQYVRTDRHQYADRLVQLHFFLCQVSSETVKTAAPGLWIDRNELCRFQMPVANKKIVEWLLNNFESLKRIGTRR